MTALFEHRSVVRIFVEADSASPWAVLVFNKSHIGARVLRSLHAITAPQARTCANEALAHPYRAASEAVKVKAVAMKSTEKY